MTPGRGRDWRHQGKGLLCPKVPWEPPARSQARGVDSTGQAVVMRTAPQLQAPGWLDFTLLLQMFPDVCSHWTGGVGWGAPEGRFVSYPGVSTQALCPARLPPSGPLTPSQPPFPFPTSISNSPQLFIATSTNCVRLRLASAGPMPVVPTLLPWVDLLWWIWAESPGVRVGGSPRNVCAARRWGAPLNSRGR